MNTLGAVVVVVDPGVLQLQRVAGVEGEDIKDVIFCRGFGAFTGWCLYGNIPIEAPPCIFIGTKCVTIVFWVPSSKLCLNQTLLSISIAYTHCVEETHPVATWSETPCSSRGSHSNIYIYIFFFWTGINSCHWCRARCAPPSGLDLECQELAIPCSNFRGQRFLTFQLACNAAVNSWG